jgi:hypothetical protein
VSATDAPGGRPTRVEPTPTELTQPFWDATRDQRLLLQWCTGCEQPIFYPRERCPRCMTSSLEWRPASGRGEVYEVTVDHRPQLSSLRQEEPFAVVLVELEEGVRMMSNVVDCPPDEVKVGMPVTLTWEPLSDGRNLPQFRPS